MYIPRFGSAREVIVNLLFRLLPGLRAERPRRGRDHGSRVAQFLLAYSGCDRGVNVPRDRQPHSAGGRGRKQPAVKAAEATMA